jgi:hypothetical protein
MEKAKEVMWPEGSCIISCQAVPIPGGGFRKLPETRKTLLELRTPEEALHVLTVEMSIPQGVYAAIIKNNETAAVNILSMAT